ncbi:hypothetical protein [Bacillus salipaludis]|uniref:hypothetical protein n=1 Tax=Bacillus salipaludis TaxID=2547811 RepID=UPI002E1D54CF|nr:hypothetical protein [Bacillus salipaludis]
MKSLLKTIALGTTSALLFGVFAVMFFIGAFPKDPDMQQAKTEQQARLEKEFAKLKAAAEWKREYDEDTTFSQQCSEPIASSREYVAKDMDESYNQFEDEMVEVDEVVHCE